jgi:hypothetical protein
MYGFNGFRNEAGRIAKRVTLRRSRTWVGALLLVLMTLAMQVGTVGANPPGPICLNVQCISMVKVVPHGQYANIAFHTNIAGIATVQVAEVAPKTLADGTLSYSNTTTDSFAITPAVNEHAVELPNLKPNTDYYYLINATKGSTGNDAQYHGTFTTLKRYVKATINEINLLDDTEWNGAGDVVFNLYADFNGPDFFPSGGTTKWNSNETKTMNISVTTVAGNSMKVSLRAWEWDDDQQGWLPGYPITIGSANTAGLDGDNASASKSFDVSGNGHDEVLTQNFSLVTTSNDLKFKAYGSIDVWYAA